MRELQPGQNQPLGGGRVVVGVHGEPPEDFAAKTQVGAVLLDANAQARDLSDVIGVEQPRSADGAVTFAGYPPEFQIELDAVPAAIARIAIVLTVKPGMPPGVTFSIFTAIRAWLTDAADKPQLLFPLPPTSRGETAMIMAELYRHQGRWKFRAVGQGFAAGLPALAAHFGLRVPQATLDAYRHAGPGSRRGVDSPAGSIAFSGTGFCIHPDGYVLTNHHVIEGAREILARSPRQRYRLEAVFADPTNDLALLRAEGSWPGVATFRDGRQVQLGEAVIVVGYPLGGLLGSGPQVTTGNVSSLIGPHDDTRSLQFTAPTQSGNSGGPLLDSDGAVVGVVSSKLNVVRIHEMTGDLPQNVNFAIKAALARSFLDAVGVDCQSRATRPARGTADIAAEARDFVVKIECQT